MIKHMHKVMTTKDGNHGLEYGFLLNKVFAYFDMSWTLGKDGSSKKIFTLSTLEDKECILRRSGVKSTLWWWN